MLYYDAQCGLCAKVVGWLRRLDVFHSLEFIGDLDKVATDAGLDQGQPGPVGLAGGHHPFDDLRAGPDLPPHEGEGTWCLPGLLRLPARSPAPAAAVAICPHSVVSGDELLWHPHLSLGSGAPFDSVRMRSDLLSG